MSMNNFTELNLGTWSGLDLRLIHPFVQVDGRAYFLLDLSRNGSVDVGDALTHASLDQLFNGGRDVFDSPPVNAGVDNQRSVVIGPFTVVLPTTGELLALRSTLASAPPSGWTLNQSFASATLSTANVHELVNLSTGVVSTNGGDNGSTRGLVVLEVMNLDEPSSYQSSVQGTEGNDFLQGTAEYNTITALAGQDSIFAGEGDDQISVSDGLAGDYVDGGPGWDSLTVHTRSLGQSIEIGSFVRGIENISIDPENTVNQVVTLTDAAFQGMSSNQSIWLGVWGDKGANVSAAGVSAGRVGLSGTNGADSLAGSANSDWIYGNGGNDVITGGWGYDSIYFNASDRSALTFEGQDRITDFTIDSNELVFSSLGFNLGTTLLTSGSAASLTQGQMLLVQGQTSATVFLGYDSVAGSDFSVTLDGVVNTANLRITNSSSNGSNDGRLIYTHNINGTNGNDSLLGTAGSERLSGNDGNDTLTAGAGNDTLNGGNGNDLLLGGLGDDFFYGNAGSDTIDGGEQRRQAWFTGTTADNDRLDYSTTAGITADLTNRTVTVRNETGQDSYINIEEIHGGANAADLITGRTTANVANFSSGGSASMYLYLRGGSDTVNITPYGPSMIFMVGGATAGYHWSSTGINAVYSGATASVSYGAHTASGQLAGTDQLSYVGNLGTTSLNDTLDFRNATLNQYGISTAVMLNNQYSGSGFFTAFLGYGGSDTVLGNGSVTLDFSNVNGSNNGLGLNIDLTDSLTTTKTVDVSNLYRLNNNVPVYNGTVTFSGVRAVTGTFMADTMRGGANNDIEIFIGGGGDDFINGRSGYDRSDYGFGTMSGLHVELASGEIRTDGLGTDTLRSIENIGGTRFDDIYDARGFVSGISQVVNQGSLSAALNEFIPRGGNDTIYGNGNTRINYDSVPMPIVVDLAAGYADARLSADKTTAAYSPTMGRDVLMGGISEVRGTSNDDMLIGGGQGRTTDRSGFEYFTGLAGNDTINGGGGFDFAIYVQSINGIDVDMRKTTAQVQDGYVWTDPLTNTETRYFDTLIGIENIQGSHFDDTVQGGSSEFYFNGRRGADRVTAGSGYTEVQYDQDPAAVTVMLGGWVGNSGTTITSGFGGSARDGWGNIDLLQGVTGVEGSAFADVIVGGTGHDVLDGRAGNDSIDGGSGNDWVEYNQAATGIEVDLSQNRASNDGQGGADVLSNIENVRGGMHNDSITGNALANVFEGAGGNDTMNGGDGLDTAVFTGRLVDFDIQPTTTAGQFVVRDLRGEWSFNVATGSWSSFEGTDLVTNIEVLRFQDAQIQLSGFNMVIGTEGPDSLNGTSGADWMIGQSGNDSLNGGAGNDILDGGEGSNTLVGGAGDDTLTGGTRGLSAIQGDYTTASYVAATASITATLGSADGTVSVGRVVGNTTVGTDTLIHVDRILGSAFADTFTIHNSWYGSQFRNGQHMEITGGAGNDTIVGNGVTRIGYSDNSTPVNVVFSATVEGSGTATRGTEVDTFSGVMQVRGSSGNDTLQGGIGDQIFRPAGGNDTVDGGAGTADRVEYLGSAEGVNVSLATTAAQFISTSEGTDVLRNIEVLSGSYYNDSLTGGEGNETLNGYDGDDTIIGGLGTNVLWGGIGNDALIGTQRVTDGVVGGVSGVDYNVASYNQATGPIQVVMGMTMTSAATAPVLSGNAYTATLQSAPPSAKGQVTGDSSVGSDTLINLDAVKGTEFDDTFVITSDWAGSQFNGFGPQGDTSGRFFEVRPGAGNDTITGNDQTRLSYVHESEAPITVRFTSVGAGTVEGLEVGLDTFTGVNQIRATNADDRIYGSEGREIFRPEGGNDTVDGGAGKDRLDFRLSSDAVSVDLGQQFTPQFISASQGTDFLMNIEEVQGSIVGNDTLTGNAEDNLFLGDGGNDTIDGKGGFDTAVYRSVRSNYTIVTDSVTGVTTVTDLRTTGLVNDGRDTLRNVEALSFSDITLRVGQTFAKVDPAGTWLNDRTADSSARTPTSVSLSSLGVVAGDLLYIQRTGDYKPSTSSDDSTPTMMAVFVNDAGTRVAPAVYFRYTTPNQSSGASTDVSEDFDVNSGSTQVQVPTGATRIQFSPRDIFFADNTDPDNDYGVSLLKVTAFNGTEGGDNLYGTNNNDTLLGHEGNDYFSGGNGDDVLRGSLGDDYLTGGAGSDNLDGGEVRRLPWLSTSGDYDRLRYYGPGGIQVNLDARTVVVSGETGIDNYSGIEEIQGVSNVKDVVTGRLTSSAADVSNGGVGMFLWLQGGNDEVTLTTAGFQQPWSDGVFVGNSWSQSPLNIVGNGNQILVNYTAAGTQLAGQDRLTNVGWVSDGRFNDTINLSQLTLNHLGYTTDPMSRSSYNTVLVGYGGSDTIIGNGQTTVLLSAVSASLDGKGASVDLTQSSANLSNLTGANAAMGTLTLSGVRGVYGTMFNDTLIGGVDDGFEGFRGDQGDDFIDGRTGWDRADYRNATSSINVNMAGGTVVSTSAGNDTLRSVEAIRGTYHDDVYDARGFVGGSVSTTSNVASHWSAQNEFSPEGGDDEILGNGMTRLSYELAMTGVYVDLGDGVAYGRYDPTNAEQARLAELTVGNDEFSGVSDVRGSAYDDMLVGGGQGRLNQIFRVEFFRGGAGHDTIDGGAGIDWAQYDSSPAGIVVDMRLSQGQVVNDGWGFSDTLINTENVLGSMYDDVVTGGDRGMNFSGFGGNDRFVGNANWMNSVFYTSEVAGVEVRLQGWVGASGALDAGFTGSARDGWGNIDQFSGVSGATGSNLNDSIYGSNGNDLLDGRGGSDYIDGGAGFDWVQYTAATVPVHVDLAQGRAYDDGQGMGQQAPAAAVDVDTLLNIEAVRGGMAGDRLIGNAGDNWFEGNAGNDTISGGAGNDVAQYTGNRSNYNIYQMSDGRWVIQDLRPESVFDPSGSWTFSQGTDTLHGVETARFWDGDVSLPQGTPELSGQVYHWRNHAVLSGVNLGIRYDGASTAPGADAPLFQLRNVQATGSGYTAELWADLPVNSEYMDLRLSLGSSGTSSFTASSLPSGWLVDSTLAQGTLRYAGIGSSALVPQSIKLGDLGLQGVNPAALPNLTFTSGSAGNGSSSDATMTSYQVNLNELQRTSDSNGRYQFSDLLSGQYEMQASYGAGNALTSVNAVDALAALKLAAGRNPNANGTQVSPYQLIAADVTGDDRVTSGDALAILKMAVGRTDAPAPEWRFVSENHDFWNDAVNGVQSMNISRTNIAYDQVFNVDVAGNTQVNLVGVLTGDVNGSWGTPANATVLPDSYFQDLAARLGAPVAQWII